jgi:two-component system response regulator FixJ
MIVAIVDDDDSVREALVMLLTANQFVVAAYPNGAALLADEQTISGCVITDVRMPQMSGIELLARLKLKGDKRPVIVLTGHGNVEMAMQAIKDGAVDFIEKPFKNERLITSVRDALELGRSIATEVAELADLRRRYATLTDRQRETMDLMVEGLGNKEIAERLGISARTVEVYRAWVLNKMGAKSLAHLVRMGLRLSVDAP